MIEWYVRGSSFGNCNCDHACPCQFEGLPTHGNCEAMGVVEVAEGAEGAEVVDDVVLLPPPEEVEEPEPDVEVIDESESEAAPKAIG